MHELMRVKHSEQSLAKCEQLYRNSKFDTFLNHILKFYLKNYSL